MLTAAAGRGEGKASVSVVLPKEGTEWRIGDADDVRDFRAGKVLFSGFNCRINRFPLMGKDIDAGCVSVSCWKWNGVRVCNPAAAGCRNVRPSAALVWFWVLVGRCSVLGS